MQRLVLLCSMPFYVVLLGLVFSVGGAVGSTPVLEAVYWVAFFPYGFLVTYWAMRHFRQARFHDILARLLTFLMAVSLGGVAIYQGESLAFVLLVLVMHATADGVEDAISIANAESHGEQPFPPSAFADLWPDEADGLGNVFRWRLGFTGVMACLFFGFAVFTAYLIHGIWPEVTTVSAGLYGAMVWLGLWVLLQWLAYVEVYQAMADRRRTWGSGVVSEG